MSRAWLVACALTAALALPPAARAEVTVQARVSRSALSVGETTTLEVVVRGAGGGIGEPAFDVPDGLEVLSSGRSQSFEWVNGRSSSETVFRYEISPVAAGRYALGPMRVAVGRQTYQSGTLSLSVTAAAARVGPAGGGPAALRVDVEPARPWVGQPVMLRVRLLLRAPLAEDPQYTPPGTPGFWTEPPSPPVSYYADEGDRRVLVTETRARLYPLAAGAATVGEASAIVALVGRGGDDPSAWLGGRVPRREVVLRSSPVRVDVRPLPRGAPEAFDGAVGELTVSWQADRARTTLDVPVTVWLDVRGEGNLPLIHTPSLASDDFEVFAGTVDDSLGPRGEPGGGRRRFQWTVLPRREGRRRLEPPEFAWFDPRTATYRRAALAPIEVRVEPALRDDDTPASFPRVFLDHPVDPFARPAQPWGGALAGFALAAAIVMWRIASRPAADAAERARQREWLRAVGLARGPDFWRAADEAAVWLEGRGLPSATLRREIAAARFGGGPRSEEGVRRRLIEGLGRALPPAPGGWGLRAGAVALAAAAAVSAFTLGPHAGDAAAAARARQADERARSGDVARAAAEWTRLWEEGGTAPGLAARLAWAEAHAGGVGSAAAWVLRGRRGEPRDRALAWVSEHVREAGGLVGASVGRLPLRSLELGLAAFLLAALAGLAWPRRVWVAGLAAAAMLAAAAGPVDRALAARVREAVVREPVTLEGAGVTLDPGQVVRILGAEEEALRVAAGRGAEGRVAGAALEVVDGGGR